MAAAEVLCKLLTAYTSLVITTFSVSVCSFGMVCASPLINYHSTGKYWCSYYESNTQGCFAWGSTSP